MNGMSPRKIIHYTCKERKRDTQEHCRQPQGLAEGLRQLNKRLSEGDPVGVHSFLLSTVGHDDKAGRRW